MASLAITYHGLNRLDEAEELEVRVLNGRKKVLGPEHPDTLSSMANLAIMYDDLNRLDEAEELEVRVLNGRKQVLGAEHPDTLWSMEDLARTWKKQDNLKNAISLMSDAVRLSRIVLGAENSAFMNREQSLNLWVKESSQSAGKLLYKQASGPVPNYLV